MSTIYRSRTVVSAFATVFMLALSAPIVVHAEEQDLALAPVPAPSWDETSGYGAVEAIRAEPDMYVVPAVAMTGNVASGSRSVEANRVMIAQHALQVGNLGGLQEDALAAIVVTGASWDEISGYGSVETSRATIGHPTASTTHVPSDVRWAPSGTVESVSSIEASRVDAAQHALQSRDLGGLQEEALTIVVSTGTANHEPGSADHLPVALATGQRSESAHLATVPLPADSVRADSDDRIANALFGDQSSDSGAVELNHAATDMSRVATAQQALLAGNLGSMQEEALAAVVAASSAEDDASVDAALASTRATLLAQFRAVELSSSRSLGANQHLSSCAVAT